MSSHFGVLAATPEPPYYAVIFSSLRKRGDASEYAAAAQQMEDLAALQPGYLGMESLRDAKGCGITVSYWESLEAIAGWKRHADHLLVQRLGRERWYERYRVRISKVERAYTFSSVDAALEPLQSK